MGQPGAPNGSRLSVAVGVEELALSLNRNQYIDYIYLQEYKVLSPVRVLASGWFLGLTAILCSKS